jgi:Bacterial SH3 domain
MSKQRLMQAREFMNAKRYDEARAILEGLDHPRAKEWLAQIEKEQPRSSRRSGGGGSLTGYLVTIFVSILLTTLVIAGLLLGTRSSWYKPSTMIVQGISTATRQPGAVNTEAPTEEVASGLTGVVQSNQSINVRSGPGTNFQSVKSLLPGTEVEILGQNPDGTWRSIRLSDGTEGWVSASLLDISDESLATAEATVDNAPPACQGSEAQTWWNGGTYVIYNLTLLNVKRFEAGQIVAENLSTFVADVDSLRQQLEQTSHPDCVETVHETFLSILSEIHDTAQAYAERIESGQNANAAFAQLQTATARYAELDVLLEIIGIVKFSTSCEIDRWLVTIWPDFEAAQTAINGYDPATITPQIARPQIFDLRRYGQNIQDAAIPECGATAQGHLVSAVGAAEALFQAIYESNNTAAQANQGTMYAELDAFYVEMNRIGFPINRPR